MRNVVVGYRLMLYRGFGFVCRYFLSLTPPVNGFAELPAALVSELCECVW